jgi:predicted phosphate transport protein (TIGR00153 family)
MVLLFRKTKELEEEIDHYLDLVIKGGLYFKQGVKFYLENDRDDFEDRLAELDKIESEADMLRRTIENKLYTQTLIPEARGDVLGLLESTDRVLNLAQETLHHFSIESPEFLQELNHLYTGLTEASVTAIENLVAAIRAYFNDISHVRDYINKVLFYEKESDKLGKKIKKEIFSQDIHLSRKIHLRYFIDRLEKIADSAEDTCDRLAIAAIKRSV